ncbi:MAG TPA: DPP IV N-terminal domain-containing protein [Acidimicrobiales bacterium]|nr:DPP IV N-terminal domain-containing protein [Acidimicrobiales bacterium]
MGALVVLAAEAGALEPGRESETVVLVRNTGTERDDFLVAVQGPASVWARVDPAVLTLDPGQEAPAWVRFAPPLTAVTPAGPVPFFVAVTPRRQPDVIVLERGVLDVAAVPLVRAALGPPDDSGSRWVGYLLRVANDGNASAAVGVEPLGDDRRFMFEIDPAEATIGPGDAVDVAIRVRGPRRGRDRERSFSLAVMPDADGSEEPLAVVSGVVPSGSTLASELTRSAVGLAVVLVVLLLIGVRVLRGGGSSGDGASTTGGSVALGPGSEPTTAAGDGSAGDPSTTVEAATPAAADAPSDLATLVFVRVYSPTQRDLVVRFGGSAPHEVRLRSDDATESRPALSPSSSQVAYVRERAGAWSVCVVAATGGDPRCLADAASSSAVAWFPSGDRLLFSRGDTLYAVALAGGDAQEQPVKIGDGAFSLSADGTRVVFADHGRLVIRNLDGSPGIQVTVPTDASDARWSPDGTRVVYVSDYQVYTAPAGDGPIRRITAQGTVNNEPAWSPDGTWIVFRSIRSGSGDLFCARADSQGGNESGLARVTSSPERDLSPSF